MNDLMALADDEFADELNEAIFDDEIWAGFLDPDVCRRARPALVILRASLMERLREVKARTATRRELIAFIAKAELRLAEVKTAVSAANKADDASIASLERKWGMFAQTLAEIVNSSDLAHQLSYVLLDGDLNAEQWLRLRHQKAPASS
ncbi:hypothetical protein [Cryobacterium sp. PH31-O1]|uniref:hypothetical protein n=1 Tax=Cryobacterium sp. PH31-O1 TaxID=3046306 RepID=UPI0024BA72C3|nr:hypothetical protein [Cryobacterium sp. PH31-O1]MDJ0337437.1 hypothetical protein [Cryobacterium sp. PH31-O1]